MLDFLFGTQEKRKTVLKAFIILVIALLALMVFNFILYSTKSYTRLTSWINPERYQSVFLTNGQVYFGKVSDINSQTLILEDVYYLKKYQNLQTSEAEEINNSSIDDFSLVKLGGEIHGPEDRMSINLEHVLFIENLEDNSKVVDAIKRYEGR